MCSSQHVGADPHLSARADTSARPTKSVRKALQAGGRRSTSRPNGQQHAADQPLECVGSARVVQVGSARGRERINARAHDARRTRRTMLGCPEVTEEVVVLELTGEQKEGVK